MKSIHSKAFFDVWRALYHESNPGPTVSRWRCDRVDWVRETYRTGAEHCSFHIETHILSHDGKDRASWALLVVVERWWAQGRRDVLKTAQWCQLLRGSNKPVLNWFERQRVRLDARFMDEAADNEHP